MTAEELQTFVGKNVRVFREGALEGTGELLEVIPGALDIYDPETGGVKTVQLGDLTLRWDDSGLGREVRASRRYGDVWRLVEVTA